MISGISDVNDSKLSLNADMILPLKPLELLPASHTARSAQRSIEAPSPDVTRRPVSCMRSAPTVAAASVISSHIRVCTDPGPRAFTVIPVPASSNANTSVRRTTAALLEQYADMLAQALAAPAPDKFTIRPELALRITGITALQQRYTPIKLT